MARLLKVLLMISIATVAIGAAIYVGAQMGLLSGTRPTELGIVNGTLYPVRVPAKNAVGSLANNEAQRVAPLPFSGDAAIAMQALKRAVQATPGTTIIREDGPYLYAEFQTRMLKFIDDVEFLVVPAESVIHVRSQSRLGREDFGVNRARIEALRSQLASQSPVTAKGTSSMTFTNTPSGLGIHDIVVGDGAEAVTGNKVQVHYTGWLYENGAAGKKFDSSKDRGQPFAAGTKGLPG
jgi:uncharacterized protein (DUF1499 family)